MNSIGRTIQCLRKAKGVTQEKMAQQIGVTFQAISKWENEYTLPDIMLLPAIAEYFGVSIDDLFQYKWNALTGKERLIHFMLKNRILTVNRRMEKKAGSPTASTPNILPPTCISIQSAKHLQSVCWIIMWILTRSRVLPITVSALRQPLPQHCRAITA